MCESVSFDRAATFYDESRGLPPETETAMTALLVSELTGRKQVLEIGVGTGRIALPLHDAGIPVVGIDLSRLMMDVLVSKTQHSRVPLAQADATRLPFAADSFDAAIASHVFHLIPSWHQATTELLRVLQPGARILIAAAGDKDAGWRTAVREHFRRACSGGGSGPWDDYEGRRVDTVSWFLQLGAVGRELPPIPVRWQASLGTFIDGLEAGEWSWTWTLPAETLRLAAARTRKWARQEYGSLEEQRDQVSDVCWLALDLT